MLLVLLIIAAGGVPIIENPNSTLLNAHPRFQHLVQLLRKKGISTLAHFEIWCLYLYYMIEEGCDGMCVFSLFLNTPKV